MFPSGVALFAIALGTCVTVSTHTPICEGGPGKCDGFIHESYGHSLSGEPVQEKYVRSVQMCKHWVIATPWCFAADLIVIGHRNSNNITFGKGICRLFNTSSGQSVNLRYTTYLYRCCKSCTTFKGWCDGRWVRYNGFIINDTKRSPIYKGSENDFDPCLKVCQSPLYRHACGWVNLDRNQQGHCQIFMPWPNYAITTIKRRGWWSLKWKCCKNATYEEHGRCQIHSPAYHCPGKWKFESQSMKPPKHARYLGHIFVISWKDCLRECTLQPFCVKPWYNQKTWECSLQAGNSTEDACAQTKSKLSETTWMTWTWQCCSRRLRGITTYSNTSLKLVQAEGCVCLTNSEICFKPDNCSLPASKPDCLKFLSGTAFMKTNNEVRFENKIWKQVWNGYEYLWMYYKDESSVHSCDLEQCKIFSGAVKSDYHVTIFRRHEWFAQKYRCKEQPHFKTLPNTVVVLDTYLPPCGCYSKLSCSQEMRNLQIKAYKSRALKCIDIYYHFVIGSDGIVYEGIGWKNMSTEKQPYQKYSIIIAFIGNFEINSPTLTALTAAKQLIAFGAKNGYITRGYSVQGFKDYYPSEKSETRLYAIVHNWPHYSIYESRKDCPTDFLKKIFIIISSTVTAAFVLFLGLIIAVLYKKERFHSKYCRKLRRTYQFHLCQPGGVRLTLIPVIHPYQLEENRIDLGIDPNNLEVSLENAEIFFLSETEKLNCRCLFHMKQLAQFAKECDYSFFIPMVNNYTTLKQCCIRTCIFLILPHDCMELVTIVCCHFRDPNNIRVAANTLRSNNCICRGFQLQRVHYGFETVKDKFKDMSRLAGRTGPMVLHDDPKNKYSIESKRFTRVRKRKGDREVFYRMYTANNLRQHIP